MTDSERWREISDHLGRQLGAYRIDALLGVGGMGQVYRARDTRLGRDVAIKILPDVFASDAERLARFQREARVLAALNHPHIASIYGFEETTDVRALVLELVEGPTLGELLDARPQHRLAVDQALRIASQIAQALEAAHARGIIHRDLKPANIKVAPGDLVKILDFGLAKAWSLEAEQGQSQHVTVTMTVASEGALMGTAAYMSPEQARGKAIDVRTDVWAFGCVLFEMLAGEPAFSGETLSDTLAQVLEREPPWRRLPSATPARIRQLLRRCLDKNADQRVATLAEARRQIEACLASPFRLPSAVVNSLKFGLTRPPVLLAFVVIAVGGAAALLYSGREHSVPLPRLTNPLQVTRETGVEDYPTLSPDGRSVAYESNQSGNWDIWVSQVADGAATNRTSDNSGQDRYPSWSPDGRQVAFWSDRKSGKGYYLIPARGGEPVKLLDTRFGLEYFLSPAEWSPDGRRIALVSGEPVGARFEARLHVMDLATRESRQIQLPGSQESRLDLSWSHDGRYLAYLDIPQQPGETSQLMIYGLDDGEVTTVTDATLNIRSPRWAPDDRSILFVSNQARTWDLWRQRLDAQRQPVGEKERVTTGLDILHTQLAPDGTRIAYAKGRWVANVFRVPVKQEGMATWADAQQLTFDQAFIEFANVSFDGKWIAFSSDRMGNQDLWRMAMDGSDPVRVTSDASLDWNPNPSPDGTRFAFYSNRTANREIFVMPVEGGPATQLTNTKTTLNAGAVWSYDGRYVAFRSERAGSSDIWIASADGRETRVLSDNPAAEYGHTWSPDGNWIAYTSNRNGLRQLFRTLVSGGRTEQLTEAEAGSPVWSPGGQEILYRGLGQARATNFFAFDVATRSERRITDFKGRRGDLNFQPPSTDGTYLYFTWREDLGDIWVMDVN